MKKTVFFIPLLLLLFAACKKDSSTKPSSTTTTTPPPANPYYFKFSLDGVAYNLNANYPQYMPFYENEIGGYQDGTTGLFPSLGIRLAWPYGDTVKESDVMGLKGKTLYYNDILIHPELIFEKNTSDVWYSVDTSNTTYSITITNVTYLKNDTTLGNALRTYVITGTCSGVIDEGSGQSILSNGQFNFVISRKDY